MRRNWYRDPNRLILRKRLLLHPVMNNFLREIALSPTTQLSNHARLDPLQIDLTVKQITVDCSSSTVHIWQQSRHEIKGKLLYRFSYA